MASTGFAMFAGVMFSSIFENYWLVDTGAFYHMTHDRALFQTYTLSDDLPLLETAGAKLVRPIGYGTVVIYA
jgi:hypothetical protein